MAEANAAGEHEEVSRKLSRLDRALADMAERAARFYHLLGDLSRTNDVRPEVPGPAAPFAAESDVRAAQTTYFTTTASGLRK